MTDPTIHDAGVSAELAAGLPTVVVVASRGSTSGPSDAATAVQGLLAGASLRVYISDDALAKGVALMGAVIERHSKGAKR